MSLSEIERFAADLKSNEVLRAEAAKAQAGKFTRRAAGPCREARP